VQLVDAAYFRRFVNDFLVIAGITFVCTFCYVCIMMSLYLKVFRILFLNIVINYYYYYYYYYYICYYFLQSVYNYVPETNHVSRVYIVPAIL
jgi:hypothetical protein